MNRLPQFVVLGLGKAGSSLIWRVLRENPSIGLSHPKELHFFSAHFEKGLDWYRSHFDHIEPDIDCIGEVSPSYLKPEAVTRIAEVLGRDTKVIFTLRRPIERAYSRYVQNLCARPRDVSFFGVTQSMGMHLTEQREAIALCYDLFGSDNVLPLFFERDIAGPNPAFEAKILAHLGLPQAHFTNAFSDERVNPGVMPRYLLSGAKPLSVRMPAAHYLIPPNHLVFCAQHRNNQVVEAPSIEAARAALAQQSHWTAEVSPQDYALIHETTVRPAAEALETAFGYDMSHWETPARRLSYPPAPPPAEFLQT